MRAPLEPDVLVLRHVLDELRLDERQWECPRVREESRLRHQRRLQYPQAGDERDWG
jgi:hypothetical protein